VNDGIDPSMCSLSYVSVDDAAREVFRQGQHSLMAKVDIKSAYRNIPVHPDDRWLLGMQWGGAVYVDAALPFGLRSAPKIFTAVADAVEWILRSEGVNFVIHYLDDFLLVGPPNSDGGLVSGCVQSYDVFQCRILHQFCKNCADKPSCPVHPMLRRRY